MLRAGQIGWEAHVWREGYGDWKTADESDTLVRAVASIGASGDAASAHGESASMRPTSGIAPYDDDDIPTRMKAAPAEQEEPTRMAVNAPVIGQPQALAPQARSAFAARASAARNTNFGSAPPVVSGPPAFGANVRQLPVGRSPRVSAAQAMTAERNEDSVLFSANNLVPSSTQHQSSPPRAGYAAAEGSGLIDIRALAALAHSNRQTVQPDSSPQSTYGREPVSYNLRADEPLPAIAHQAGTFGRIDSLSPIDRAPSRANNAVPIAILAGSGMIAVAAFLAVYLTQQPAPAAPTAVAAPPPSAEPIPAPSAEEIAQPEPSAEPAAEPAAEAKAEQPSEPAADEPAAAPEPSHARNTKTAKTAHSAKVSAKLAAAPKAGKTDKAEKPDRGSASAKMADEPAAAAEKEKPSIDDLLLEDAKPAKAVAEPAKAKEPAKSRSIDDLLDGATDKKPAAAAAPAADSSLPETPSRDDVKSAMSAVASEVKACAEGQALTESTATVALTISGATGRVQSVRVTGNQGAVGTCIARAVRAASFPKFSKPSMTINFPFKLK
jgi:hypothetical protein